ncbi:zinc finger domain-containing protein [Streptomyces sp. NBC_01207]|uniref:zinc finger domain-containing protein n=1 Tax=Streptomyces sp. NBC_01207 TaxID=2903772 RepID=UPI002E0FC573|nr:hypothetical protein OG457_49810 [Streptomyces sp. NBC_01207]
MYTRNAVQAETLTRFLAELSPRPRVRAAAGERGEWRNVYPEAVTLAEVDPARPVAMYLTRRRHGAHRFTLVPLDFDAKRVPAAQAAADAELLAAAAAAEDIEPVPALSGPTGGRHVWLGCAEGIPVTTVRRIARAARTLCPSLDTAPLMNAKAGAVRPPGAAHRLGGHSELTAHTVEQAVTALGTASARAEAFERLAARLETMAAAVRPAGPSRPAAALAVDGEDTEVPPSIRQRGPIVRPVEQDATGCPRLAVPWRPLGERAVKGLRRNLTTRQNFSDWAHASARSMALAGWTQAEALAVVRDAESSPALEWLRSERQEDGTRAPRDEDETARLWARVWWLAVQDAARMPRRPEDDGHHQDHTDAEAAVADLVARMQVAGPARWGRESGPADAAVLMAVAWLMISASTTDVSANVRRVGTLAGYTYQTASLALWRLIRDGWLTVTAEANRRAGQARRVTLATEHECPEHKGHRCAIDRVPETVSPVHPGSDRRRNAAAAPAPAELPTYLRSLIAHQQAGVWHTLGHHAARTLWQVQEQDRPTLAQITAATGYGRRATLRHLRQAQALQLITTARPRRGATTYAPTGRPLYEAGQETGTAARTAHLAAQARVDQAAHDWWASEEEWSRLTRTEKRRRGLRPGPDQQVIPGMAAGARAYPRTSTGSPDHARAREIEAERIGAAGMLAHAQQLAQCGQIIDPAHLSPTGAQQPKQRRRRAVLPARQHCRHCQAAPGERCVTWRGQVTAEWHAVRRTAAEQAAGEATRPTEQRSA